jgi:hypothetical protein
MSNELVVNGIRTLWQDHVVEADALSLNEIRHRARKVQSATQRWNLFWYVFALIGAVSFTRFLFVHPSAFVRAGAGFGLAAIVYGMYLVHKGRSAQAVPESIGLTTCVAFHRAQLERQRDFLLRSWRYLLLPIPGAILFAIGVSQSGLELGSFPAAAPVLLYAIFIIAVAKARRRQAGRLQREIDAMNVAEKEW